MSTRERIMTIRLLEKIKKDPAYAELIGIEVTHKHIGSDTNTGNERSM